MDRLTYIGALCDAYRTARQGQACVARRQQRLQDIVAYARAHSPYYRREEVQILPLAIATVAEEIPGMAGCQLIQRTPSSLTVRLRVEDPRGEEAVWAAPRNRLAAFLSAHGAPTVTIEKADEAPALHPRSGKFREVYCELTPERSGHHGRP